MLLDYIIGEDAGKKKRIEGLVKEFGMERFLERNIHEDLSGGEIKKAGLLLLLTRQPTVIDRYCITTLFWRRIPLWNLLPDVFKVLVWKRANI